MPLKELKLIDMLFWNYQALNVVYAILTNVKDLVFQCVSSYFIIM